MSKLLDRLNPSQREAVTHTIGPLLIIAGPGSGKTRTIVHSIAYAIENLEVDPSKIAAFTFTNKAKDDLKERVGDLVQDLADDVWISTFHSFCGSVLHQDAQQLDIGDRQEFTVSELTRLYNDGLRVQIEHLQHHRFAEPEDALRFINECRAADVPPAEVGSYAQHRHMSQAYVEIYQRYRQLSENDETNYTEYQLLTNALFREVPEVRKRWQEKFDLIFVDEYQDTDPIQYRIIKTLAEPHRNLRVVGDDDQGIYGWRGADIRNILNFENDYPTAKPITLGQNYRSTKKIVAASSALADFNPERRDKELFTGNCEGERVKYFHFESDEEEASTIANFVHRAKEQGNRSPSDFAVLYRNNKQANAFKKAFSDLGIDIVRDSSDTDTIGVSLMTIHKSKGLEFPNVFVAGICKDLLPNYYNRDEKDWDEELRLLYVAMTRAKNWLCLSSYQKDKQYERGCSPFLAYIPSHLLESVETLGNAHIPPCPKEMDIMRASEGATEYVEQLPEKLLGYGMTVLGVDPGIQNVGWSVTRKSSGGYTVLKCGTQTTTGWQDTLVQTENKVKELIISHLPDAIAVEKIEIGKEETRKNWFLYVAGCVATIKRVAHQHGIACQLYTPQQVKYTATNKRNASKQEVQEGVLRICNLQQIPEPHHSADAIAASLCYLRSYLHSARFEGKKRKQEHYDAGIVHLDNDQYSEAIAEFNEARNIDPIDAETYYGLGCAYLRQGHLEAAEDAAKEAVRIRENNYPDAQYLFRATKCYRAGCNALENSEWNVAIEKFKESINLERVFTEAHCGLSRAYLEVGKLGAAKSAAEEALRLRNEYPGALTLLKFVKMRYYYNGEKCFNRENYDQAILEFQKAVEIDPNYKEARLYLGKTYFQLRRFEAADKEAREVLRVDSTYEPASELLGEIKKKRKEQGDDYRKKKAYTKALKSYQHAIRIDNKYKEAYHNLGILYRRMKRYDEAIIAYQKAIDIDERSHVTYSDLSFVYRKIGAPDKAVDLLKHAIKIKPDYQRAYHNLADTCFEMKNLQDASKNVLKALELTSNHSDTRKLSKKIRDAYLDQGQDGFSRGDIDEAEISAKAALELDHNNQIAHELLKNIKQRYYNRGRIHLENHRYNEAIAVFRETIDRYPRFIEAQCDLGRAYFRQDQLQEAERAANAALWLDSGYQPGHKLLNDIKEKYYNLSLTYLRQSKWKSVEKFAKKALRIDPKCKKTYYHLGRAYFKMDRLKEARRMVEEALRIDPNYLQAHKFLSEIKDLRNWLRLSGRRVQQFARRVARCIGI